MMTYLWICSWHQTKTHWNNEYIIYVLIKEGCFWTLIKLLQQEIEEKYQIWQQFICSINEDLDEIACWLRLIKTNDTERMKFDSVVKIDLKL